jgi:hypothetical protein
MCVINLSLFRLLNYKKTDTINKMDVMLFNTRYFLQGLNVVKSRGVGGLRPLPKVVNSIIFIFLTPNPKGGHLKIIELANPPLGVRGSLTFRSEVKGCNLTFFLTLSSLKTLTG